MNLPEPTTTTSEVAVRYAHPPIRRLWCERCGLHGDHNTAWHDRYPPQQEEGA